MSSLKRPTTTSSGRSEQQSKVDEVRELLGPLATAMPYFVTDKMIRRFLVQKSWKTQKASKAMMEAIKWRMEYKPEAIRWEDVTKEAEAGKIYMADYSDKQGRPVLIVRPGSQRSKSSSEQLRCFVYHLEKLQAAMGTASGGGQEQEQVVVLSDFHGWVLSSTPVRDSATCLHILQSYYPGLIGLAVIHNPPRLFQVFWKLIRPFVDDATYRLARFVYSGEAEGRKVMEESFDVDAMEAAYGGTRGAGFDVVTYGRRMMEEDGRMEAARQRAVEEAAAAHAAIAIPPPPLETQVPHES